MKAYDKKQLRSTLDQIDSLLHKAKMELHEVHNENERILKMFEYKQTKASENIVTGASHLIGRTPKRITSFSTGYTYEDYLLIECEDGQRIIINGRQSETIRLPNVEPEKMIKTGFYTDKEIQNKINYLENEKHRREQDALRKKQEEFEKLQKELNKQV